MSGLADHLKNYEGRLDLFEEEAGTHFSFPCCACQNQHKPESFCRECRHFATA